MEKIVITKLQKEVFGVLLFFRFLTITIIIIFIISVIIFFSDLKIILNYVELNVKNIDVKFNFNGKIGIYFLGKIRIFAIKINNTKINRMINNKTIRDKFTNLELYKNVNKRYKTR